MKILLILFALFTTIHYSFAQENAVKIAKTHLGNTLSANISKLSDTYAENVTLMAGHEFLKPSYGLAKTRDKPLLVKSAKLIEVMEKAVAAKGKDSKRSAEQIEKMLASLKFETLETTEGNFATEASDPVGTPDGKLHFTIVPGDVVFKVSPPRGDFLLYHLRKQEGKWKVISEYLD